MNEKDKNRLLEIVREKILLGEFTLTSGKTTFYYFDGRLVTLSAEGAYLVGEILFDLIADLSIDAIGGPTLGADPIVAAVIMTSFQRGSPFQGFIVRGEIKDHGTQKQIEGHLQAGWRVVIVDDVITTGGSIRRAIDAVEANGCQVVKVVTLLDRLQGGSEELQRRGYDFTAIFKADTLGNISY